MKQLPPYTYGPRKSVKLYDFKNKDQAVRNYGDYMLSRTQQIFKWHNLPDTIPQRNLEHLLQTCGHCIIVKDNNSPHNQYALIGGFGGEPNVYYEPTIYTIANPALPNIKQIWTINTDHDDAILIRNDSNITGLLPLLSRYCTLLVENDISFRLANINTRISNLISAQDDRTLKSARKFISDIERGELGIISSSAFFEGLQVENSTRGYSNVLKDLIEYHQYIRASMYNEIGLDANYNMKRAVINEAEVEANEDALFPLVDDMLEQRKIAAEKWNELYDMNISVELNSVWENNHISEEQSIEAANADIENTKADTISLLMDSNQLESDTNELENEESNTNDINTDTINNNDNTPNENEQEESTGNEEELYQEDTEPNMERPNDIEINLTIINGDNNTLEEEGEEDEFSYISEGKSGRNTSDDEAA